MCCVAPLLIKRWLHLPQYSIQACCIAIIGIAMQLFRPCQPGNAHFPDWPSIFKYTWVVHVLVNLADHCKPPRCGLLQKHPSRPVDFGLQISIDQTTKPELSRPADQISTSSPCLFFEIRLMIQLKCTRFHLVCTRLVQNAALALNFAQSATADCNQQQPCIQPQTAFTWIQPRPQ